MCEDLSKPIDLNMSSILIVMLKIEVLSSQVHQFTVEAAMQQFFSDEF